MHLLGVRGVRLNLASRGQTPSKAEFSKLLRVYANRIRHLRWALQIYIRLPQVALIAEEIPNLGITVIIDHLGHPYEHIPIFQQDGYAEFMDLLRKKHIYTKLSGIYRFPNLPGLDDFVRQLLFDAPSQVIWASDWPHSGGKELLRNGDRTKHQDYRRVDDSEFVAQCLDWCGKDEELVRKIWVDNPRRLWQFNELGE
ncbi:hypothetical protein M8818_005868 [Zalaria obscura]|uniref:Uncharacterized protein n=1 Tax=Zalaria obscura TaxID=2024903 RepID=A0ACC3S8M8_9PEZI